MNTRTNKIIDRFNVGDNRFSLTRDTTNDSRSVVDDAGAVLLWFDSSCGVWQGNKKIGVLLDRDDVWTIIPFIETGRDTFATSQPINDYHWYNLQRAEVEVAQHLLM